MTVVISDTSPINYLILIEHIEVLPVLFDGLIIPSAVHRELQHPSTPEKVRSWAANLPIWFSVWSPEKHDLSLGLGDGETEAIALAQELGADLLLIDERRGSRAARSLGLKTAGTLAILDEADSRGLLDFETAIAKLQATSFHTHPQLLKFVLDSVRKRKSDG